MATYAVVFHIHVRTPHQHVAKLFVTDVPPETEICEIKERLAENGYKFGEFNISWANHYVDRLKDAEAEVKGAWRSGNTETVSWKDLAYDFETDDPD